MYSRWGLYLFKKNAPNRSLVVQYFTWTKVFVRFGYDHSRVSTVDQVRLLSAFEVTSRPFIYEK